jgi:hypothetical protein
MTEKQYAELCKTCDSLLISNECDVSRVGISWLHVIREHPIFLSKYNILFDFGSRLNFLFLNFKKLSKYLLGWVKQIFFSFQTDRKSKVHLSKVPEHADVLFISHYINTSSAINEHDFYFGRLPYELSSFGYISVIALINHTNEPEVFISNKWKSEKIRRVVLSKTLGLLGDLKILKGQLYEFLTLAKLSKRESPGLLKSVMKQASIEALSGGTRNTLIIYKQISCLVKKLNPRIIIITHEGHAWERLAFAAGREVNPSIKCIGYQHSALFRLQHAIKRKLANRYNPDLIMTSGLIGKKQLEDTSSLTGIPISVLGSSRSMKSPNVDRELSNYNIRSKQSCLVIPEGDINECNILFNFSKACALEFPLINFIWRLHPLISFDFLKKYNSGLSNLPSNIILSDSKLEDDISNCQWVLYRGTTAIIQAIGEGLKPLYFQICGEMTIDPLYQIDVGKIKITNLMDFGEAISNKQHIQNQGIQNIESDFIKMYCSSFFTNFKTEALLPFLSK